MTEGSETWEVDSKGKVVDICGTREILYFNLGHKYSKKLTTECNMYGTEGNLFSANIPEENNKFNSWNFRDITLVDEDFLSLDVKELAKERGEDGSLPEINFMKLNPEGPNYNVLKTIEEEMKHYEILSNGTIVKILEEGGKDAEEDDNDKKTSDEKMKEHDLTSSEINKEEGSTKEEINKEVDSKDIKETVKGSDIKINDNDEIKENESDLDSNKKNDNDEQESNNEENDYNFYLYTNNLIFICIILVVF